MKKIQILNIPNYYSSYYLLGLKEHYDLVVEQSELFRKYNNKPLLIYRLEGKIVVIDNDDPSGIDQELYNQATLYFVTNKLKDSAIYSQAKIRPLFPHYPINAAGLYTRVFGLELLKKLPLKEVLRQLYILSKRPFYKSFVPQFSKDNFVFFSSNIWKKEPETNQIRAAFIRFCKADSRIRFEGGFIPRSDGNNQGFEDVLNTKKYSPKEFSKWSAQSKIALNNPAVCGAVSWRLAEYLNQGLFVLSFPFKIELPQITTKDEFLCYVENITAFEVVLNTILIDSQYHEVIAQAGKKYFETYCTPKAQIQYIADQLALI